MSDFQTQFPFTTVFSRLKETPAFASVSSVHNDFRERLAEEVYDAILEMQKVQGWKTVLSALLREGVVLYYYSFALAVQRLHGAIISDVHTLQSVTGIYEMEPTDYTIGAGLSEGSVWSNEMNAQGLLRYVYECGKGFSYVRYLENMIRKGTTFRVLRLCEPTEEPFHLLETFAFGSQHLTKYTALAYALAMAKDFFIEGTIIDAAKIQDEIGVPSETIGQAIVFRKNYFNKEGKV